MPYRNGVWVDDPGPTWTTQRSQPTTTGAPQSWAAMVNANPAAFGLSRTRPTGTTGSSTPVAGGTNLIGQPGTGGSNTAYGTVPQVPDPTSTTASALSGNLRNLGSLFSLGGQVNDFTQGQLHGAYVNELGPNYESSVSQAMDNIYSNLRGEIPAEVMRQFQQDAAERGVAGGTVGSGNIDSSYLTNVLRNRLELQKQGAGLLSDRIRTTPIAEQFKPGEFMVSPDDQFNAQMMANMYAAAPNPAMAAAAQQAALRSGVNYGAGAGGGAGPGFSINQGGGMPNINWGGGPIVGNSTGTGTMIGGTLYNAGTSPTQGLGTAWQNWASSISPQWNETFGGYQNPQTGMVRNETVGGYVNPFTGALSDTSGGTPWAGFSWEGVNTPAVDENAQLWDDWMFYGGSNEQMPGAEEIDYYDYYGG